MWAWFVCLACSHEAYLWWRDLLWLRIRYSWMERWHSVRCSKFKRSNGASCPWDWIVTYGHQPQYCHADGLQQCLPWLRKSGQGHAMSFARCCVRINHSWGLELIGKFVRKYRLLPNASLGAKWLNKRRSAECVYDILSVYRAPHVALEGNASSWWRNFEDVAGRSLDCTQCRQLSRRKCEICVFGSTLRQ